MKPIELYVTGTVGRAIADYSGVAPSSLSCYPDPKVPGTYAFRASFPDGTGLDFLVIGVPLADVTGEDLEETDFETWPPVSGDLNFFV